MKVTCFFVFQNQSCVTAPAPFCSFRSAFEALARRPTYLHYPWSYSLLTHFSGKSERVYFVWHVETRVSIHAHSSVTIAVLIYIFFSITNMTFLYSFLIQKIEILIIWTAKSKKQLELLNALPFVTLKNCSIFRNSSSSRNLQYHFSVILTIYTVPFFWPTFDFNIDLTCLILHQPTNAAVMVWIHGGSFNDGSAMSYDYYGVPMAAVGDVIVVTINYRVNIFSRFSTGKSNHRFYTNQDLHQRDGKMIA